MRQARSLLGETVQGESPDWQPLLDLVEDERVVENFMWMYEVELSDGSRVHAYKHIDTRRYIHLQAGGVAFAYLGGLDPERYRQVDAAEVFAEVFAGLPGLAGVTDEQIDAASRAVGRVRWERATPGL